MKVKIALTISLMLFLISCESKINLLERSEFECTVNDQQVSLYTLYSPNENLFMQVTNYGARVVSLWVPDKYWQYDDIVLGYENINKYLDNNGERFLGAVVGRYANRIAKGSFQIEGETYTLSRNNNGQCLHGGLKGLDGVVWHVDSLTDHSIHFSYASPDGEEGFPGDLKILMDYTLTDDNEFNISYTATTNKATHVNLSHHSFFNLKGEGKGTITDHLLTIYADGYTPIDSVLIPTGEIKKVEGTPFDFRTPTVIGNRINENNQQLINGMGYDHNWVINRKNKSDMTLAATLYEPSSGRFMEVWTDQPGIQFYSGNFFDGMSTGKTGRNLKYRESIALETQKFPDSPNQPNFPSTLLIPGETYRHTCVYKFSTK